MTTEATTVGKVVVLTPNPKSLKFELLHKPFILIARLPRGARFLSVNSLPNLLEVMGMASGGGAPGISVLVPTMSKEEPKQPKVNRLIIGFIPGAEVILSSRMHAVAEHIGTCTSAGILLNYFEVLVDAELSEVPPQEAAKALEEAGYCALELIPYETPHALLARASGAKPPL